MSYRLPPLAWLRAFEAAARHANFAAAARELNMTQPAVSHHVRSLERHLSTQLFERHARKVELTEIGRAYLPAVRRAFAQLSASTAGLFGLSGQRELTVRCAAAVATLWLAPRLHRFRALYPDTTVQLSTATWAESGDPRPADVDIRYGDGRWQVKEVARLRRERAILVCSPDLAARLAHPITPAACAEAELIHIMGYETFWETWFRTAGLASAPTWRGVKVDNSIAALEVAASGHGVALVFEMFARPYLDRGRLVAPVSHGFESEQAHYVVLPDTDTPHAPEALAFRDWLLDEANGEV